MVQSMETYKIVADVVNGWDPIGLLAAGAPKNEYNIEIRSICEAAESAANENEFAEMIQDIFDAHMQILLPHDSCLSAAADLLRRLKQA